jgi:hypothetical protein
MTDAGASIAAQFFGITQCELVQWLCLLLGLSFLPGIYLLGRDHGERK